MARIKKARGNRINEAVPPYAPDVQEAPEELDAPEDRVETDEPAAQNAATVQRRRARNPVDVHKIKIIAAVVLCSILVIMIGCIVASQFVDISALGMPGKIVASITTPIQTMFQDATDAVVEYLRILKLRGNIEQEYAALRVRADELAVEAMMANEYLQQLGVYQDLAHEMTVNQMLNPVIATVIARDTGAYSASYTINAGTADGVENFMAVIVPGALIGYTYSVTEHQSKVRTIIDSEASTPAMIEATRDQGTLRGTLGIDGTAMCRMYYLPEDNQPRPGDTVVTSGVGMEIPKGIPVGTVREATRSLDANKQYIVVEPLADFQHIEDVLVLRYKPVSESAQARDEGGTAEFVPLATARPVPPIVIGEGSGFGTSVPINGSDPQASDDPEITPSPSPSHTLAPTNTPAQDNPSGTAPTSFVYLQYTPTPSPSPSPVVSPSPTPTPTFSPDQLTLEEDE